MRNNFGFWLMMAGSLSFGAGAFAQAPQFKVLPPITAGIHAPARVAVGQDGRFFVSEPGQGRVSVLDAFGRVLETHSGLGTPLALAVDDTGRIYVSDQKLGSVSIYDARWQLVSKLGAGEREFGLPGDVTVGAAGGTQTVYVCDGTANQVKAYRNGGLAFAFGGYGTNSGQFDFPCGLYLSANGELFVLDQNNDRVQVFDAQGTYRRKFTLATYPVGGMFAPRRSGRALGITGDQNGRIYVADGFQGEVKVFDASGIYLDSIAGPLTSPFRTPSGMAVDGGNRLLVALANSGAVGVIGLDSFLGVSISPPAQVVAAGANIAFTAAAGGPGPFQVRWRKGATDLEDGGPVSGSGTPMLQLTGVTSADSGSYSVQVTRPGSTLFSPACALTVLAPPSIAAQPTNQTTVQTGTATFAVVASGDDLVYQWLFNGNNIAGATSSVLTLTNVSSLNAGLYAVQVGNSVGNTRSASATLDVIIPPRPPTLEAANAGANGLPTLTLLVDANQSYNVEASTNLVDWTTLTNVFTDTGTIELADPSATEYPRRFYRVRWSYQGY